MLLAPLLPLLAGCSGKVGAPTSYALEPMQRTGGDQPIWAALHLAPEIDAAIAEITTASGEATQVEIGEYLRTELVRAAGRAFAGVVVVPNAEWTGPNDQPHPSPEIWPSRRDEVLPPPEVIVSCTPAELTGHVIPGGDCESCSDKLSVRVDLYFQLQELDGTVLAATRVAGEAVSQDRARDLPLGARFRGVVAEAVDRAARQMHNALASMDVRELRGEPGTPDAQPMQLAEVDEAPIEG
jgi:hypothetical protein